MVRQASLLTPPTSAVATRVCRHRGPRPLSPERKQAQWLRDRAARAAVIVLTRGISRQRDGSWLVQSQTNDQRFYRVDTSGCSCADAWRAPDGWCKHRLAAALVARAQGALAD
jgi:hypothetical protein